MGYTLTSMRPDPTRRTNQMNEIQVSVSGGTTETFMYNKKPFDFTFELSVWSKTLDHLYQIIEQASSFFNPDYTVTVKEISELGLKSDVPITLDDITFNNTTEYNEEGWRILEATLNFTMRGWIYPPIKNSKIINEILVRMYSGDQTIPDYAETLFTEYTGNPPAIHQSIIDETPT
jgi:hypothetical protein